MHLEVQEDFIGLYSVDRIDAETLFRVIKDTLLRSGGVVRGVDSRC